MIYQGRYMGNRLGSVGSLPSSLTSSARFPAGITPAMMAAAAASVQDRLSQDLHLTTTQGTLDPCSDPETGAQLPCGQLTSGQRAMCPSCGGGHSTGDASPAEAHCACLLNAIPGLAADAPNFAQGHTLCMQDPAGFEAQVRGAGWTPHCDETSAAVSGGSALSHLPTVAKVGIGIGAVGIIGAIAFALLR